MIIYCHGILLLSSTLIFDIHNYNTRRAAKQSYCLPESGKKLCLFYIRFQGPKVWNLIDKNIKTTILNRFKENISIELSGNY